VDREAAQNSIARLYTALVAGIDEVEAQIPRVGTDRRATDFVDHEQAVAGKERTRSRSVPSRSLGDGSLAPLMIKTIHDENTNQYL
jgi:hypothetical protein